MKLGRSDYINAGSGAAAILGMILALIGCFALSVPEGIGVNLNLSPVVYVGVVLIAAGLVGAIVGNRLYIKNEGTMNRAVASAALYVTVLFLLLAVVLVAYTIFIPVINPSNG